MDVSSSFDTNFTRKLNRRFLFGLLTGATFGFGIGITVHALWQRLFEISRHKSQDATLDDLSVQLSNLKSELDEVHRLLQLNGPRSNEILPDEEDEFYDAVTDANSFQTAIGDGYTKGGQRLRIGPPVPAELLLEMDQMAEFALGECSDSTHSAVDAAVANLNGGGDSAGRGDDYPLGLRCYSHALVYNSQYRRSPEFLWRFSRAIFLAGETVPSRQMVYDQENDTPLFDAEATLSEAASVSSLAPLASFDPRSLNDIAYATASRRELMQTGLVVARRAMTLALFVNRLAAAAAASCDSEQLVESGDIRLIDQTELAHIYKWLAIYVGVASEFGGIKQRLTYGHEFKELIEHAIALNPLDHICHHLKGRWCLEVYGIRWIERQIASRLFGKPPTASLEEAEKSLGECERLRPGFYCANMLYLAKCCISRSDYKTASAWLVKAKQRLDDQNRPVPPSFLDSISVVEEVNSLVSKYQGYCEL